ncbi:hypothetical protein [Rhizobium sp. P007]|jgi:hypothetical protein|uniref:hypothetical protein n=1 Tax=Rhizobium sp. P007 TaxID=285908 RepID=UPI001157413A|nr:hypothetical protein [Rhizobium sp. P007]CAD7045674.1 hypothetical protein RP007_04910 [Rhizobium sp. P007]
MSMPNNGALIFAAIAFVIGTGGGYALNELDRSGETAVLEQEIAQLKEEVRQRSRIEVPSDEEASAAIARSGRSIRISECKPHVAVPGVTCTGMIITTSGSFAGKTQPGVLSFAKIDGVWAQIQ